jgi:hypothetical protein
MNVLMSNADYAPWLMDVLKLIEEEKVKKIAVVGITAKGEVITGYYHMEMSDKALASAHMQADAVLDSVCSNGDLIQRRWAEQEEEEEDADEI